MPSCSTRQLPQAPPPSPVTAKPQRGISHPCSRVPNNDRPRFPSFLVNYPPLAFCHAAAAPSPWCLGGLCETLGKEDEPRLAADRLGSQPNPTCMPAPTVTPARTLAQCRPSPGVVRLSAASSPHLTTPTLLALPRSPWPSLANQSHVCPSRKLRGASRSPLCLIDVPYAIVSVMRAPTELRPLPHI